MLCVIAHINLKTVKLTVSAVLVLPPSGQHVSFVPSISNNKSLLLILSVHHFDNCSATFASSYTSVPFEPPVCLVLSSPPLVLTSTLSDCMSSFLSAFIKMPEPQIPEGVTQRNARSNECAFDTDV